MKKIKIINVWDAYCGWCFGFEPIFLDFYKKHQDIELEMISGGLFVNERVKQAKDMPFIKEANKKIKNFFDIHFGEPYMNLMDKGTFVFNSSHPAAVFYEYKKRLNGLETIKLATKMQHAFFVDGKNLSEVDTYLNLVKGTILENSLSQSELIELLNKTTEEIPDFERAQSLGISSYPTVLITNGTKILDLREGAMTQYELEKNYNKAMKIFEQQ